MEKYVSVFPEYEKKEIELRFDIAIKCAYCKKRGMSLSAFNKHLGNACVAFMMIKEDMSHDAAVKKAACSANNRKVSEYWFI
jgi:hypothetical protein